MNNTEIMDIQAFLQLVIVLNIAKRVFLTLYRGMIKIILSSRWCRLWLWWGWSVYMLILLGRKRILNYM